MMQRSDSVQGAPLFRPPGGIVLDTARPSYSGAALPEQALRESCARAPHDPAAHQNLAVWLSEHKQTQNAIRHYEEALRLRPHYPEALRNYALLLTSLKRFSDALRHLWLAVAIRPNDVPTLLALGTTLMSARRTEESIPVFRQACRFASGDAGVFNQLGVSLFDAGQFQEAEKVFLKALDFDPKLSSAHNNLGSLYKAMGRMAEAFSCFEFALTLEPDSQRTRWNRALTLLAAGAMELGWREYEWRWKSPDTPPKSFDKPLWSGESLEGKTVLLHPEQGLGDTLQFIRYAKVLKQRGATVLFACQYPLLDVVRGADGIDQVLPESDTYPPFDYHVPLLGLPHRCGTVLENIPADIPYINADPARVDYWKKVLAGPSAQFTVGITWQGNPHHQWDHFRSIPLSEFEPLARIPGIRLVSLQRGPGIEQIRVFNRLTRDSLFVPTDGQQLTPAHLADTAALMMNLDLVVSIDSAPLHLAGALGRPVWGLIGYVADWRWMVDRIDSPWYPTMRLFRQRAHGDWSHVIGCVKEQLTQMNKIR